MNATAFMGRGQAGYGLFDNRRHNPHTILMNFLIAKPYDGKPQ